MVVGRGGGREGREMFGFDLAGLDCLLCFVLGLVGLVGFCLDWIGLDWIGLDWLGLFGFGLFWWRDGSSI